MKLVEILAGKIEEWPIGVDYIHQWSDGEVTVLGHSLGFMELASDWDSVKVTRAQWEAERARIATSGLDYIPGIEDLKKSLEEAPSDAFNPWISVELVNDHPGESILPSICSAQSYEQELWDKVAAEVFVDVLAISATSEGGAICACNAADAFMAERAKRLKQGENHE